MRALPSGHLQPPSMLLSSLPPDREATQAVLRVSRLRQHSIGC